MSGSLVNPALIEKAQTGGIWAVALTLLGLLIRHIGPWSKQRDDAEGKFRAELLSRESEMAKRIARLEAKLTRQQIRHNAERALDRHRLNNVTACFDALLLLIETSPEKADQAVAKVKAMRAAQIRAESEEKAIIRAAEIVADDLDDDDGEGDDGEKAPE